MFSPEVHQVSRTNERACPLDTCCSAKTQTKQHNGTQHAAPSFIGVMFSEGEDARRRLDSCAEEQAGIEIVHTKGAKCVSEHVNTSLGCTWPYRNRCAADIHARTTGYEFHRSEHSRSFPRASKLLRMNARVCLHVEYRVGYQQGEEWNLSVDLSFCRRACCLFGVRVLAPQKAKK